MGQKVGEDPPSGPTAACPLLLPRLAETAGNYSHDMDDELVRGRLEEERTRLGGLRDGYFADGLTSESEEDSLSELSSVDQHQADVGTETFNRERDLSILERVEAELADVEHALRRLDDGSYGTCEACGNAIGEARLEAMPAARFCLQDQALAEREARQVGEQP
ncbi:MAG: hypothetical protein CYG61_00720 [Actinobacteria bacterium]|nr:MAG: hypothetical protein CYG61_00720 [Actinomycetota bacterium]